jgi:hypothetical protein
LRLWLAFLLPYHSEERGPVRAVPARTLALETFGEDADVYPGVGCVIATCANAGPRVVRNPTLRWLPSQNGLLADAPHRHSATRVSCLTSVWS